MSNPIPAAALNQHIAVLGKTGSGKTYAAKGIVESLLDDGQQVCILDPTSAWWGLRLGADGKRRGFDRIVLLGGQHADIPLAERSGAAVARLVTEQGASVVIDTGGMTVGEYTRWFIDFAGTLYTTIKSPLHLVIDEAHHFMPQGKVLSPDAGKMLHAGNRLMSGGRSKGVRGMMITQRPQKLHKDSLTCADTLIAMRLTAPQDRAAVKEWIDGMGDPLQGKRVLDSLAGLQRGQGWVWYPEGGHLELTTFPKIRTYDSSATPEDGAKAGPKVAEIDMGEVRAAMAEAVKEAEANDPKLLRAEIERLKAEARKKSTSQTDPAAIQAAVATAVAARDREWQAGIKQREQIIDGLKGRMGKAAALLHVNGEATVSPIPAPAKALQPAKVAVAAKPVHKAMHKSEPNGELTGPQQAILDIIATLNVRGITANRDSIARWLDIHPNGGSYGTNLGYLRSSGYLDGCTLTDQGEAAARARETGLGAALEALPDEPKRNIMRALVDAGKPLSRDELAAALGLHPNGGSYGTNLGRLRTMGLITERGPIQLTQGAIS